MSALTSWRERLSDFGIRSLGAVATGNLVISLAAVLTGLVLARTLDADERGHVALAVLWSSLGATILSLGSRPAVLYHLANGRVDEQRLLRTAMSGASLSGLVMAAIWFPVIAYLDLDDSLATLLSIAAIAGVTSIIGGVPSALLQVESLGSWNLQRLAAQLIYLAGLASLALFGAVSPVSTVVAYVVGVSIAAAMALCWRTRPLSTFRPGFDRSVFADLYRYGSRSSLSGIAATLTARVDLAVLGAVATAEEVGIYAVAIGVAGIVSPVASIFTPALVPKMAASNDPRQSTRLLSTALLSTFVVAGAASFAGAMVTPWLVPAVLGARWTPSILAAQILLGAGVVRALSTTLTAALEGLGRPGRTAFAEIAATLTTLAILVPVGRTAGARGAAMVSVLAYLVGFVALAWSVRNALRDHAEQHSTKLNAAVLVGRGV